MDESEARMIYVIKDVPSQKVLADARTYPQILEKLPFHMASSSNGYILEIGLRWDKGQYDKITTIVDHYQR